MERNGSGNEKVPGQLLSAPFEIPVFPGRASGTQAQPPVGTRGGASRFVLASAQCLVLVPQKTFLQ